jgi:hypothetical protein
MSAQTSSPEIQMPQSEHSGASHNLGGRQHDGAMELMTMIITQQTIPRCKLIRASLKFMLVALRSRFIGWPAARHFITGLVHQGGLTDV